MSDQQDLTKFIKAYKAQEFLIKEGDEDDDFFCLVQGTVGIWKGDPGVRERMVKVGELSEKGTYFGEMTTLLQEARTASIIAQGSVKVLKFPGEMLPQMIMKQPGLGLKLLTALADRLKGTTSKTEDIAMQRDALRDDVTANLFHAKEMFQKIFMILMAVQKQTQNPLVKALVEYMTRDKLLQGGRKVRVDDHFLQDLPEALANLMRKLHPE